LTLTGVRKHIPVVVGLHVSVRHTSGVVIDSRNHVLRGTNSTTRVPTRSPGPPADGAWGGHGEIRPSLVIARKAVKSEAQGVWSRGRARYLRPLLLHNMIGRRRYVSRPPSPVGSRAGAVLRRSGPAGAPRFLWECLIRPAVSPSPTPATSNGAGGFPALRSPVRFTPRVMRPILSAVLSTAGSPGSR
jgi:hypothetical protein